MYCPKCKKETVHELIGIQHYEKLDTYLMLYDCKQCPTGQEDTAAMAIRISDLENRVQ
jgi:uncharacterized OB-fold protein